MVEDKLTKLTYDGEKSLRFRTIITNRRITVKKGDVIEVNKDELKEIAKARFSGSFKELKPKESKKPDGGVKNG